MLVVSGELGARRWRRGVELGQAQEPHAKKRPSAHASVRQKAERLVLRYGLTVRRGAKGRHEELNGLVIGILRTWGRGIWMVGLEAVRSVQGAASSHQRAVVRSTHLELVLLRVERVDRSSQDHPCVSGRDQDRAHRSPKPGEGGRRGEGEGQTPRSIERARQECVHVPHAHTCAHSVGTQSWSWVGGRHMSWHTPLITAEDVYSCGISQRMRMALPAGILIAVSCRPSWTPIPWDSLRRRCPLASMISLPW